MENTIKQTKGTFRNYEKLKNIERIVFKMLTQAAFMKVFNKILDNNRKH